MVLSEIINKVRELTMSPNEAWQQINQLQNVTTTTQWQDQQFINVNPGQFLQWSGTINTPFSARTEEHKKDAVAVLERVKASAEPTVVKDEKKVATHVERLKALGFKNLHSKVSAIAERAMKENMIALAGYKKIAWAKFSEANNALRQKTNYAYELALTPIETYIGQNSGANGEISMPTPEALDKLEAAKKEGLFDSYSIIHVVRAPDPSIVGQIKGSQDMYFLAEWGDDISLDDLTK